jgi:hypothetical protein
MIVSVCAFEKPEIQWTVKEIPICHRLRKMMELQEHSYCQEMVIAFDIQTFTVTGSYVCAPNN